VIKYSLFILTFHICGEFPKKKRTHCVFECFQSHYHILKKIHEFLHMMGAIIIFEENSFILLVTKSLKVRCTFEEVAEKTKCQKMNVSFLQ
jgi:hypothetical protein